MTRIRVFLATVVLVLFAHAFAAAAVPQKTNPFHPIYPMAKVAPPIILGVIHHPHAEKPKAQNPVFHPGKDTIRVINPIFHPGKDHIVIHKLTTWL